VRLIAIVLAAGKARRFGSDKSSAQFRGEPLINHAIRAACAAPVERVIVVCGSAMAMPLSDRAERLPIQSDALSASLKAGIAAADDADGAFIFLGDMPLIPHHIASGLADLLGDNYAAIPRHNGQNGHPVLLSKRAFADIVHLSGDEGWQIAA
jgi:molybdenum cofactor cytidylyltransferase